MAILSNTSIVFGFIGFNRDPHFQRVMGARVAGSVHQQMDGFNRDPHFQRVMAARPFRKERVCNTASIGTLIFRG